MVAKAHKLGLRAGWYMGNYQCSGANSRSKDQEPWDMNRLIAGSVKAIKAYGFDSVKCDSGFGVCSNMSMWAQLLNESGRPVMIENCHQGAEGPGTHSPGDQARNGNCTGLTPTSDCPFNFWRTTGDPEPGWGTIMRELNSLRKNVNPYYGSGKRSGSVEYNANPPRTRPGGWAYPGTMVVGDGGSVANGTMHGGMTKDVNAVHFGGWCIVSSPLILAYNLSTPERRELVWDIITNKEAISVNQAWAGHPGSQVLYNIGSNSQVEVWTKPLGDGRTAAFILNTAVNNDTSTFATAADTDTDVDAGRLDMTLSKCDTSRKTQQWVLSSGVIPGDGNTTNIQSNTMRACWEITGCNTHPGAHVGTGYGCKALPKIKGPCGGNLCMCNGAWSVNSNGTITSVMDGQCFQTSTAATSTNIAATNTNAASTLSVGPCKAGAANQKFTFVEVKKSTTESESKWDPSFVKNPNSNSNSNSISEPKPATVFTIQQDGRCIDNNVLPAPTPAPPPPGGRATVTIHLQDLHLAGIGAPGAAVRVRDVWNKKDLSKTTTTGTFTTTVPYHGSTFVIFMPGNDSKWPLPFKLAPWMDKPAPPVPVD